MLYRKIYVDPSGIHELIEDLVKPGSCVAKHAKRLTIHGPVPWLALPKLMKLLPFVDTLKINPLVEEVVGTCCFPSHPRLASAINVSSRPLQMLRELKLHSQIGRAHV